MRLLVTNDDGLGSRGLHALADALAERGHEVTVVAQPHDLSGSGASLGAPSPERLRWEVVRDDGCRVVALDGSVAMCVLFGASGILMPRPQAVVVGLNHGLNVGRALLHSATVGAALTAANMGLSALAVSLDDLGEPRWDTGCAVAVRAVDALMAGRRRTVLNVNVPNLPLADVAGVRIGRLSAFGRDRLAFEPDGPNQVALVRSPSGLPLDADTDAGLVHAGFVSVSPVVGIRLADVDHTTPLDWELDPVPTRQEVEA